MSSRDAPYRAAKSSDGKRRRWTGGVAKRKSGSDGGYPSRRRRSAIVTVTFSSALAGLRSFAVGLGRLSLPSSRR